MQPARGNSGSDSNKKHPLSPACNHMLSWIHALLLQLWPFTASTSFPLLTHPPGPEQLWLLEPACSYAQLPASDHEQGT
jgi:hypothetical protein